MGIDNTTALERIESAQRELPFCYCGRHMRTVARTDGVWLECISRDEGAGGLRRVLTLDFGHLERRVLAFGG